MSDTIRMMEEIRRLKAEKNAVILAHNYVAGEIQDVADFVGDSLELSIRASDLKADRIVFCGVRFMGETGKLLSPDALVVLPAPDADCPMARMASAEAVRAMRAKHPDAVFIAYVNSTAEVKAQVDICCTSGNAERVVGSVPPEKEIVFLPDRNLGANLMKKLGRSMILWEGCCPIHDQVTPEMIRRARAAHPGAPLLVHLECRPEVVALADGAMSTAGMLKFVKTSSAREFVIGTESGILHRLKKENPGKAFYSLEPELICRDMKKLTLPMVLEALRTGRTPVELEATLQKPAESAIRRMLDL